MFNFKTVLEVGFPIIFITSFFKYLLFYSLLLIRLSNGVKHFMMVFKYLLLLKLKSLDFYPGYTLLHYLLSLNNILS